MAETALLAVRAISAHYDASRADDSVLTFLSKVGMRSVHVHLRGVSPVDLPSYLRHAPESRGRAVGVSYGESEGSSGLLHGSSGLQHVAAVMALASVRAAVDNAAAASSAELSSACSILEQLLAPADPLGQSPFPDAWPLADNNVKSLVQVPTLVRHTRRRRSVRQSPFSKPDSSSSPLSVINARLRLSDIAGHALAVVVRGNLIDRKACCDSLELSTRLLILGAKLPRDSSSATVLGPAIETAASRVGAIVAFHVDIDPGHWLRAAADVLDLQHQTPVLLAPLFGGMISSARPYTDATLDSVLTARAALILSTLLLVNDREQVSPDLSPAENRPETGVRDSSSSRSGDVDRDEHLAIWRAAAFEFLGERVVSIEGDSHEPTPSNLALVDACDEYCRQSGEENGVLGLVTGFLSAAARQYVAETQAEADVVRPVPTSGLDESDEPVRSGVTPRSDSWVPPADIFDLRSPTAASPVRPVLSSSAAPLTLDIGSRQPAYAPLSPHADSHRQVAALCLDALVSLLDRRAGMRGTSSEQYDEFAISAIVGACDGIANLSHHAPGTMMAQDPSISDAEAQKSMRNPDVAKEVFTHEATVARSVREFSAAAGDWLASCSLEEGVWEDFAASISATGCSLDVVGSVLWHAPAEIRNRALVESFVALLSLPVDPSVQDLGGKGRLCVQSLVSAARRAASLFTAEASTLYLSLLVAGIGNVTGISPASGDYNLCRSIIAIAFLDFAMRVSCGEQLANALTLLHELLSRMESVVFSHDFDFSNCVHLASCSWSNLHSACGGKVRSICSIVPKTVSAIVEEYINVAWDTSECLGPCQLSDRERDSANDFKLKRPILLRLLIQVAVDVVTAARAIAPEEIRHVGSSGAISIGSTSSQRSVGQSPAGDEVGTGETFLDFLLDVGRGPSSEQVSDIRDVLGACTEILREPAVGIEDAIKSCLMVQCAKESLRRSAGSVAMPGSVDLSSLFDAITRYSDRFAGDGQCTTARTVSSSHYLPPLNLAVASVSNARGTILEGQNASISQQSVPEGEAGDVEGAEAFAVEASVSKDLIREIRRSFASETRWFASWTSDPGKDFAPTLELVYVAFEIQSMDEGTSTIVLEAICELLGALSEFSEVVPEATVVRSAVCAVNGLGGRCVPLHSAVSQWVRIALHRASNIEDETVVDMLFFAVVAGTRYSRIIVEATDSRNGMDAFVAVLESSTSETSRAGLSLALGLDGGFSEICASISNASWFDDVVDKVHLDGVVQGLLIPRDDSAVCVESSASTLTPLSKACRMNPCWARAVIQSLNRLCVDTSSQAAGEFVSRLCQRSIIDSVTMSAALCSFIKCLVPSRSHSDMQSVAWAEAMYNTGIGILRENIATLSTDSLRRAVEFCFVLCAVRQRWHEQLDCKENSICMNEEMQFTAPFASLQVDTLRLASSLWGKAESAVSGLCVDRVPKTIFITGTIAAVHRRLREYQGLFSTSFSELFSGLDKHRQRENVKDLIGVEIGNGKEKSTELSSKLCTFTSTGSQFVEQHWYFCYTCGLIESEGVCVVCAQVCHRGHDLSYSRHSRFFCDCGATSGPARASPLRGASTDQAQPSSRASSRPSTSAPPRSLSGDLNSARSESSGRVCQCLRPRTSGSEPKQQSKQPPARSATSTLAGLPYSSSAECANATVWNRIGSLVPCRLDAPSVEENTSRHLFSHAESVESISLALQSEACVSLLTEVALGLLRYGEMLETRTYNELCSPAAADGEPVSMFEIVDAVDTCPRTLRMDLMGKPETFSLGRRSGSPVDGGFPAETRKRFGSRVSFSVSDDVVAYVDGKSKVGLRRVLSLTGKEANPSVNFSPELDCVELPFVIQAVCFNGESPRHLLVYGDEGASVCAIGSGGTLKGRVDISVGLQEAPQLQRTPDGSDTRLKNSLIRADWVLRSSQWLIVVTNVFVKVFNPTEDALSPIFYAVISADKEEEVEIVDAVVCHHSKVGHVLFVAAASGVVYRAELNSRKRGPVDLRADMHSLEAGSQVTAGPVSLAASELPDLLWILCGDGTVFIKSIEGDKYTRFFRGSSGGGSPIMPWRTHASLTQISTSPTRMLVSCRSCDVSTSGVLELASSELLRYETCAADASGRLEGYFVVPGRTEDGFHPSSVVILDDGRVYLIRFSNLSGSWQELLPKAADPSDGKVSPGQGFADIVEEVKVEMTEQAAFSPSRGSFDLSYNPVPPLVGFFENARLVSDDIVLGGDIQSGSMRVSQLSTRSRISQGAGPGRDGFVGPKPREKFVVLVQCTDHSLALVGVRVQVGGSERSRTQSPGVVRVFGRALKLSIDPLQSKRWIDIPISVPEAVQSPREIRLEFEPRRAPDGSFVGDGTVAFDSLEVYGVRASELAERKKGFESDLANHNLRMKDRVSSMRLLRLSSSVMPRSLSKLVVSYDFQQHFDEFPAAILSCLSMAAEGNAPMEIVDALALHSQIYSHSVLRACRAFRRYVHSPEVLETGNDLLGVEALLTHLGRELLVDALAKKKTEGPVDEDEERVDKHATKVEVVRYAEESWKQNITRPWQAGVDIPMGVFQRAAAALARTLEDAMTISVDITNCASPIVLLDDEDIVAFCDCFLSMPRSRLASNLCLRDTCSDVVDVVFTVLWGHAVERVKMDSLAQSASSNIEPSAKCLVDLVSGRIPLVRLFTFRRVVDLFQGLPQSGENLEPVVPWFDHTAHAVTVTSGSGSDQVGESTDTEDCEDADDSRWTFKCDICKTDCEPSWWHCAECEDFDLCETCVKLDASELPEPHQSDHLLLRGLQDALDSTPHPTPSNVSLRDSVARETFHQIAAAIVSLMSIPREDGLVTGFKLLESVQLIQRLASPPTAPSRRALFLAVLFDTGVGLHKALRKLISETDPADWGANGIVSSLRSGDSSLPGRDRVAAMENIFLLIRLLASLRDVAAVPHMLSAGILETIGQFLKSMVDVFQKDVASSELKLPSCLEAGSGAIDDGTCLDFAGLVTEPETEGVPVPLMCASSSTAPSGMPSVFKASDGKCFCFPALEAVESMLDLLVGCLGSVAGHHLELHRGSVPLDSICAIVHLQSHFVEAVKKESSACNSQEAAVFENVSGKSLELLRILCGRVESRVESLLDQYAIRSKVTSLFEICSHSNLFSKELNYDAQLELTRAVSALHRVAVRRPHNWRIYISTEREGDVSECEGKEGARRGSIDSIPVVLYGILRKTVGETRLRALQLVVHALGCLEDTTVPQLSESGSGALEADARTSNPGAQFISLLSERSSAGMHFLVSNVILRAPDQATRKAGSAIIQRISQIALSEGNHALLNSLGQILVLHTPNLPAAGPRGAELSEALAVVAAAAVNIEPSVDVAPGWVTDLGRQLSRLISEAGKLLSTHPNAHIYRLLSSFVVVDGYFLESEPCMSCSSTGQEEAEYVAAPLDSIRTEAKYTHKAIFCRLAERQSVSGMSVKVVDPNRSRLVKTINVFHSVRTVADAAELKTKDHEWRKSASIELPPGATEAQVDLDVPLVAANVMFEFAEFYASTSRTSGVRSTGPATRRRTEDRHDGDGNDEGAVVSDERLQCPRCSRQVTDRYGICRSCGENSFQCRACRNINYEFLDGFLCNECGYCKHGRFDFSLTCSPSYEAEPVWSESDCKRAAAFIQEEGDVIHKRYEELKRLRMKLVQVLTSRLSSSDLEEARETGSDESPTASPIQSQMLAAERSGESSGNIELIGMSVESIVRTLMGEEGGASILPSALSVSGGPTGSPDLSASLRDIAVQMRRDGSNPVELSQRGTPDEADAVAEESPASQLDVPSSGEAQMSQQASRATKLYSRDCKAAFISMSRSIRILNSTREELVRYAQSHRKRQRQVTLLRNAKDCRESESGEGCDGEDTIRGDDVNLMTSPNCYGCTQAFVSRALPLLESVVKQDVATGAFLSNSGFPAMLLRAGALFDSWATQESCRRLIVTLVTNCAAANEEVCAEILRKLRFCIESYHSVDATSAASMELNVLRDITQVDDQCWESRLRMIFKILFRACDTALESASVSEDIILPCLRSASELVRYPSGEAPSLVNSTSSLDSRSQGSLNDGGANADEAIDGIVGTLGIESHPMAVLPVERTALATIVEGEHGASVVPENFRAALEDPSFSNPSDLEPASGGTACRTGVDASDSFSPATAHATLDSATFSSQREFQGGVDESECEISLEELTNVVKRGHENCTPVTDYHRWVQGSQSFRDWLHRVNTNACSERDDDDVLQRYFSFWRSTCNREDVGPERCVSGWEATGDLSQVSWALRLVLKSPSSTVRSEACDLLESICREDDLLSLRLLDSLLGEFLDGCIPIGPMAVEYFDLLERLVKPIENRLYLLGRGFLPRAAKIIQTEADRLERGEIGASVQSGRLNLFDGFVLHRFVALCRLVLDAVQNSPVAVRERIVSSTSAGSLNIVAACVSAYLAVRRLVSLRTKLTDQCQVVLRDLLSSQSYLCLPPSGEVVVSACVRRLEYAHNAGDIPSIANLLELLCSMLCPVKEEPVYRLVLEKAGTQEEFIRGSMTREFYPSVEFDGPSMRDVKKKICQDLDLMSLLEDDMGDFGLELLVAGNLIKLDLPIASVYEHVWRGSAEAAQIQAGAPPRRHHSMRRGRGRGRGRGGSSASVRGIAPRQSSSPSDPPMVVIYRLSGLDGEATEPIIDSLPDGTVAVDPEEEFKATEVLGRVSGLPILLSLLSVVDSWSDDVDVSLREPALRLLRASCEVASNRSRLSTMPDAVEILMDCVASALELSHESSAAVESAESLSIATERILSEQGFGLENASSPQGRRGGIDFGQDRFGVVLGHLSIVSSPKAEAALLHLLPYLMQGSTGVLDLLVSHFAVNWDALDTCAKSQLAASQISVILKACPTDANGNSLAAVLIENGFGDSAMQFLERSFPQPKCDHLAGWESSLEAPGSCLALKVLRGLASELKRCSDDDAVVTGMRRIIVHGKVLPLLCQLEQAVSSMGVGSAAEELLEALEEDDVIQDAIAAEHLKIRRARRAAAEASRAAALLSTRTMLRSPVGPPSGTGNTAEDQAVSRSTFSLLEEVADEIGPACVVCGDGFTSRPDEALGLYVLSRRMNLSANGKVAQSEGSSEETSSNRSLQRRSGGLLFVGSPSSEQSSRGVSGKSGRAGSTSGHYFTNVTHFNAIHLSCHRESARADRSNRQPRDEWDGAALRNSQTRCNNIFPVKPPSCFRTVSKPKTDEKVGSASEFSPANAAQSSYEAAVDYFYGRLFSFARSSISHGEQAARDLAHSISRFGTGRSFVFAEHSRGGGPHSNVCLIPHLLQLAWHFSDSSKSISRSGPTLEAMLALPLSGEWDSFPGDVSYALSLSLVLQSLDEWGVFLGSLCDANGLARSTTSDPCVIREIAFVDILQKRLKTGPSPPGVSWTAMLSERIACEEVWLANLCSAVADTWENKICSLASIKDLEEFLAADHEQAL